jgi:hypothetical protein
MLSAPKPCRLCKKASEQGKDLCADCAKLPKAATSQSTRVHDEVDLLYGRVRWLTFREFILHRRPMCQRLVKGAECRNPARIVHHLISPRVDMSKFVDADNVLALCEMCHTPEEGTPHWRAGIDYTYIPCAPPQIG